MAVQNVNTGAAPNDGTGDPLRTAFGKLNNSIGDIANTVFLTGMIELQNIGGTANEITAEIYSPISNAGIISIGPLSKLILSPNTANTGSVFVTVAGDERRELLSSKGNSLVAGDISPNEPFLIRRSLGGTWRIVGGGISRQMLEAVDNRRIANIRDAGVIPLSAPTGTPNALVTGIATSVADTGVIIGPRAIVQVVPTANNTTATTMNVDGLGDWPVLRPGGFPLGPNDFKAGKSQLLLRSGSTWVFATGEMTRREVEILLAAAQAGIPAIDFQSTVLEPAEQAVIDAQAAVALNYATFDDLLAETAFYNGGAIAYVRQDGTSYRLLTAPQPGRHFTTAAGQGVMCLGGKLIVAAGQSNIAASNEAAAGGDLTVDPRIRFWNGTTWVTWDVGSASLNWAGVAGRNNIAFQAAKQALREGVPCVYVVLDAHPGNTIDQWIANPGTGTTGPNWASLVNKVVAAMGAAEIGLAGITGASGFIWGQGENNGGASFNFEDYRSRWNWLKVHLRNQSWFPTSTPITALSMPPQTSSQVMDRFFKSYLPYDGDPYTSFTDTSDQTAPAGNLMHWTGVAMNVIGQRAWESIVRGGGTQRAPNLLQTDIWRWQPEPVSGFGLGWNWVPGATVEQDRFVFGTVSNLSGVNIAPNYIAIWRTTNLIQMVQHTEFLAGMTLKSYTTAQFTNINHAVNTDQNKKEGTTCWDVIADVQRTALGTGAAAVWKGTDGSIVTPVIPSP